MISFDKMKKEDIPYIVKLEKELLLETLGEEMLQAEMHNKYAYFIVAKSNNKPIGYIGGWIIDDYLEIINFVVDKNYQRQGIGTKLFDIISHIETVKNCTLDVRESNNNAINFYYHLGFKKIGERKSYYKNGEDAFILEKEF